MKENKQTINEEIDEKVEDIFESDIFKTIETRTERANKEREKRRLIRRYRKLASIFIFAMAVTSIIWILSQTAGDSYRNEKGFIKYADAQFDKSKSLELVGNEKTEYQYGEPISYAVDYTACKDEGISAFRDTKIEGLKAAFAEKSDPEDENPRALLIKTGVTDYKDEISNLAIYCRGSVKNGGEMESLGNEIYTYQFSVKTGDILVPQQILKDNYRQRCSQYFMKYFDKEYKKEQLAKDWKKYLTPDANNFNKFIVTNSGITFCFDEGTVLKKSEGIAYAGMASVMSKEILREHIIQRYIDPSKPMVALTFDDGPGGESEDRILTCLENNNSVATFFYQGMFIGGREEKIKRAKSIGCEIGHHTWNHPVLTSLNDDEVSAQITNTNNAIYNACGAYPTVFRPSYGMTSDKINQISGMPVIMWSIDTLDWKLRDGQKIYDKVVNSGNLDGKIVLMHSIHGFTADAVDSLVPWLKSRGYQLVTVSEMIKYKTGADPVPGAVYR